VTFASRRTIAGPRACEHQVNDVVGLACSCRTRSVDEEQLTSHKRRFRPVPRIWRQFVGFPGRKQNNPPGSGRTVVASGPSPCGCRQPPRAKENCRRDDVSEYRNELQARCPSSVQRTALYHATPGPPRCLFGTSHRLTNLRNQLNRFPLTDFGECLSTGLCYFGRRQYIFTDADKTRPLSKFRPLSSGFDADFSPTSQPRALYASALSSRISGAASALSKAMDIEEPFRTLFTNAGRKHAIHVPALCRTLL
jgi:hypothetical protein